MTKKDFLGKLIKDVEKIGEFMVNHPVKKVLKSCSSPKLIASDEDLEIVEG